MKRTIVSTMAALICAACAMTAPQPATATAPATLAVPIEYHTLPNGLRVVLSTDHASPRVTIVLYYGIGYRLEPRNRTGFAHLFEHLLSQGSRNLGKMEHIRLVQSNGGVVNMSRAALYNDLEREYGLGRAHLLAGFALFYDDPARINRIESRFTAVTPELIRKTAEEYLRPANRTIFTVVPKARG